MHIESGAGAWVAWIPFLLYYSASIPQIIENYRGQSTEGLSFRTVFIDYMGGMAMTIYAILLALPWACEIMEPLTLVNIGIMACQGYYYSKSAGTRKTIIASYIALHSVAVGIFLLGFLWNREIVGHSLGWASFIIQCFTLLPQVIKNRRRGSVEGLSFIYISLLGIGGIAEMCIANQFEMPHQSFFNGFRGLIYYSIFCYQFWQYRWAALYAEKQAAQPKKQASTKSISDEIKESVRNK